MKKMFEKVKTSHRRQKQVLLGSQHNLSSGLQDFSWSKIPKLGKYTKLQQNIPNGHQLFPMAVK
jgi:hypothetical protein